MSSDQKDGKDLILTHELVRQAAIKEAGVRGCKIAGVRAAIPTRAGRRMGKAILGLEGQVRGGEGPCTM